jgi:hypothetical protein
VRRELFNLFNSRVPSGLHGRLATHQTQRRLIPGRSPIIGQLNQTWTTLDNPWPLMCKCLRIGTHRSRRLLCAIFRQAPRPAAASAPDPRPPPLQTKSLYTVRRVPAACLKQSASLGSHLLVWWCNCPAPIGFSPAPPLSQVTYPPHRPLCAWD